MRSPKNVIRSIFRKRHQHLDDLQDKDKPYVRTSLHHDDVLLLNNDDDENTCLLVEGGERMARGCQFLTEIDYCNLHCKQRMTLCLSPFHVFPVATAYILGHAHVLDPVSGSPLRNGASHVRYVVALQR